MIKYVVTLLVLLQSNIAFSLEAPFEYTIPEVVDIEKTKGDKDFSVGGILNFQGTDLEETKYQDGEMSSDALKKASESGEYSLLKESFLNQKQYEVSHQSSILNRTRYIRENPEQYVDWLSASNRDECADVPKDDLTIKQTRICDEFRQITENQCLIGRKLQVKGEHTYECFKEKAVEQKSCFNKLTVKCEKGSDCDSKGIVLTSLESDMKWQYKYPHLIIGTIADDYWKAWCSKFVRNTKFLVKNKELIDEFKIVEVGFDDYMRVTINGTQIYNGPFGGSELRNHHDVVTTGDRNWHKCDLGHNWRYNVNIDLLPYLIEGENEIKIEVVVGGAGEGWLKIKTQQHCCIEKDIWEEKCRE